MFILKVYIDKKYIHYSFRNSLLFLKFMYICKRKGTFWVECPNNDTKVISDTHIFEIYTTMEALGNYQKVFVTLPDADLQFLRTISKRMGWNMKKERKSGIDKGLEDIRKGNVFRAKNSDDLLKQILG